MIDHEGHALLYDFSLLTIVSDDSTVISSSTEGGTIQWMSPELLDPDRFGLRDSRPTKKSDCYALGMVVYEVLSGRRPFAPAKATIVIWMVLEGQRPERPQGEEGQFFTDAIWEVLGMCWKQQPRERTSVEVVLRCLEGKPLSLGSTPDVDVGAETDTSDASDATTVESSMASPFHPGLALDRPLLHAGPPAIGGDNGHLDSPQGTVNPVDPSIPPGDDPRIGGESRNQSPFDSSETLPEDLLQGTSKSVDIPMTRAFPNPLPFSRSQRTPPPATGPYEPFRRR